MSDVTRSVSTPPPDSAGDHLIYRIIVIALAAAVLIAILGALVLAALGIEAPDGVFTLAAAAAAGLVGLLAPSPVG